MIKVTTTEGNFLKRNVPYKTTKIEVDLHETSKIGSIVNAKPIYFAIGQVENVDSEGVGLGTYSEGRIGIIDVDGMNRNYSISAVLVEGEAPSEDLVALSIEMYNHVKSRIENYSSNKGLNWIVTIEE